MPSVEQFLGEVYKLKGFLIQVKIKIVNKGAGLLMVIKQVAYAGLFLLGRALKWFKLYFMEIQENRLTIINLEVKYIFLIWEGFCKYIMQIFRSFKEESMAEEKLKILQ